MSHCLFIQRPCVPLQEIVVAESAALLLEQARAKRELAAHARQLATAGIPPNISADFRQFAAELDAIAADFEQQARNAAEVAAKSAELAGRAAKLQRALGHAIAEAMKLGGRLRATKPDGNGRSLE
jgi:methyl-accepting chemotaxis protein